MVQSTALYASRTVKVLMSWTGGQTSSEVEFNGSMALQLEENFFLDVMFVRCVKSQPEVKPSLCFLGVYLAKGVSWGLDTSLIGAKGSLPTLWRAFFAIRLLFFFLKNFLI